MPGELEGVLRAAAGRVAAADDRECGEVQDLGIADDRQLLWRSGDSCKELRVGVVSEPDPVVVFLL